MSNFEDRWRDCARVARQAPRRDESAPHGFATRVLANLSASSAPPGLDLILERLGLRALAGVLSVLLILGALEYREERRGGLAAPSIEHSVAQAFWLL